MRERRDGEAKAGWAFLVAVSLFGLALAYTLSCGPAAYFVARGSLPPRVFTTLYRPLPTDSPLLDGYIRWWGWLADWVDPTW